MYVKAMKKLMLILAVFVFIGMNVNAQATRNDVITVYNEGAKAIQTDTKAAIAAFEKVITLADQVGQEAADLKQKAVQVVPALYVRLASTALTEKKPAPEIISAAKKALSVSEEYKSDANKDKAEKILVQGYNVMASDFFAKNDFGNAIQAFDSLLAINPAYITALYNKALIYIKQDDSDSFEKTIDLYIQEAKAVNDTDKVQKASTMALEYFRAAGSKASQENKLDDALALLNRSAKYGDDKDLFYFLADVHNKKNEFDAGAGYAQKGLDMETGDAEAKAKFYYQLAVAQVGKGQVTEACASFKNAMYGPFAEASKAQRTNLKCE
jgi:tetratricopeptide (TPR) repeat protein